MSVEPLNYKMADVLKLAQVMGLGTIRFAYLRPDGPVGIPLANGTDRIFNPYENANDDVEVLHWVLNHGLGSEIVKEVCLVRLTSPMYRYKVGYFANAALGWLS